MAVAVEVKDIVSNIGKDCAFMQPLYEAITNSFEAGASEIKIKINSDESLMEFGNIISFSIEDNGEGFNSKNRKAFSTLWTKNKAHLGCKGSGRFTWLNVYKNITIVSSVKKEKKTWKIVFNEHFSPNKDTVYEKNENIHQNHTLIKFEGIQKKFYNFPKKGKHIDKRESADPEIVKNNIIDYLLLKFFLMKENKFNFKILIQCKNKEVIIDNDSIPNLNKKEFYVNDKINDKLELFTMYYLIKHNNKQGNQIFLCANNRTTKEITTSSFGFSNELPNNESLICMICSEYFDGKDNNSRNDFDEKMNASNPSLDFPIVINDILKVAKEYIRDILYTKYDCLKEMNRKEEEKAIKKAPHLTKFIKSDDDVLKSESTILSKATAKFNEAKSRVKCNFEEALINRDVSTEEFNNAVDELSYIAAIELGEYVFYRDNIIRALQKAIVDIKTNEQFIHDLFVPMKKSFNENEFASTYVNTNLWLLDDKFMTYSHLFSDICINSIKETLDLEKSDKVGRLNRPDLTIIFNNDDGFKDAIVIEFKGPNADKQEKNKSITELPNDIGYLRSIVKDIRCVWSYIITTFDDDFEQTVKNSDFHPLFTKEEEGKSYYKYFNNIMAHVYVLNYANIINDAACRNKTFLNILKKHS